MWGVLNGEGGALRAAEVAEENALTSRIMCQTFSANWFDEETLGSTILTLLAGLS